MRSLYTHSRGFTAFFAVLVSALTLSVGLAIYDLLSRELVLSDAALQSEYAIFAADAGVECALYWDAKAPALGGATSVFGTSSAATWGTAPIECGLQANGTTAQDITTQGPPTVDWSQYTDPYWYNCPSTPGSAWCIAVDTTSATTTFSITFAPQPYCATVVVSKWRDVNDPEAPSQTKIVSHGYNTCVANSLRLERALQIGY